MKKRLVAFILALAMVLPFVPVFDLPVFAATSGKTGDCIWSLDGTVLTISGRGKMGDYTVFNKAPWSKDITNVVMEDGITAIGNYAFYGCSSLTEVAIPNSVTSIGESAFYDCRKLISVQIPNEVTLLAERAFQNCEALTNIAIPDSLVTLDNYVFTGCKELASMVIPDSITSIGNYAFYNCSSLKEVNIPDSVTAIGDSAFENCTSLTSIEIPDSVTSMGLSAFYNCTSLTSATISDSVTTIGDSTFGQCKSLTEVSIPNSVSSIGSSAFRSCYKLISVTMGNEVTTIGSGAFSYCERLVAIEIPDSVTTIGSSAFWNCTALTEISVGSGVISIGDYAFDGCSSLNYNVYADGKYLGNSDNPYVVLMGTVSAGFQTLEIYQNTKAIINDALCYCSKLTDVILPRSVTSIGARAFGDCTALTDVWYEGSEAEREKITISENNALLTDATWHYKRTPCTEHVYTNRLDTVCDACGFTRSLPYDAYGTTGECFWYREGTKLTVFGSGAMENYSHRGPWGEDVTEVVIEEGVTTVGKNAFYDFKALTSVSIPDSVTSLSSSAFDYCSSLNYNVYGEGKYLGNSNNPYVILMGTVSTDFQRFEIHNNTKIIGSIAFYGCNSLRGLTIPDSVTEIGNSAFSGCNSLRGLMIPDSVTEIGEYAFYGCSGLTGLSLPSKITSIKPGTFVLCGNLASITIPRSVTEIGVAAFLDCSRLTDVWYEGSEADREKISVSADNTALTDATWHYGRTPCAEHVYAHALDLVCSICGEARALPYDDYGTTGDCIWYLEGTKLTVSGNGVMANYSYAGDLPWGTSVTEVVIEEGVTAIGVRAFTHCKSLTKVTIGDDLTTIGGHAFENCTSLTSVTVPGSVTTIEGAAFYGCSSLSSLTMENGITTIGNSAFGCCEALTEVTVPGSVTTIDGYAFGNCTALTSVTLPDSLTSVGNNVFDGCDQLIYNVYDNGKYLGNSGNPYMLLISAVSTDIQTLKIHQNTKIIGKFSFENCTALTEAVIPDSVTRIGFSAFYGCSGLTKVVLGNAVTSIGSSAFYGCSSLTSVALPASVTAIGKEAFYGCSSLTAIDLGGGVTAIGDSAFFRCGSLTSVTLPVSAASIDNSAFYGCNALTDVWYEGSETDHEKISIGGRNGKLTDATWHYNCHPCTEHVYLLPFDRVCSVCGAVRTIPYDAYGTTGECFWYLEEARLTVFGNGKMGNYSTINQAPWGTSITEVVIEEGVNGIGTRAFYLCGSLASVTLPDSLTSIGNNVFDGCDQLIYNVYDNGKYLGNQSNPYLALVNSASTDIQALKIHKNTKVIGNSGCYQCSSLTDVVIPDSVAFIGTRAFYGCNALTDVWYEGSEADREKISVSANNTALIAATWHYGSCPENDDDKVHVYEDISDCICNLCGYERAPVVPGDIDGEDGITIDDAIHALFHMSFPEEYPVNQSVDFNGDGVEDLDDAIYLLLYIFFPERYPLTR